MKDEVTFSPGEYVTWSEEYMARVWGKDFKQAPPYRIEEVIPGRVIPKEQFMAILGSHPLEWRDTRMPDEVVVIVDGVREVIAASILQRVEKRST